VNTLNLESICLVGELSEKVVISVN